MIVFTPVWSDLKRCQIGQFSAQLVAFGSKFEGKNGFRRVLSTGMFNGLGLCHLTYCRRFAASPVQKCVL